MENASKALIIAGAILLAIVIISLGLVVVNNTRSVTDNTNLNAQEIETFNNKFAAYEGTNVTGARVKSLIQAAIASNEVNSDKIVYIGTSDDDKKDPATYDSSSISISGKYTVKINYDKGLVKYISISQ